jgi:hypothetical protein
MATSGFPSLSLSQSQLTILATCPRKFQHTYLEQLISPSDPDHWERQHWGTLFHWLVQQWQLGLPVEPLAQAQTPLHQWFQSFVQAAPEILRPEQGDRTLHQPEHTRILKQQGYLLIAVYDLLITADQQAHILDWKTYPRPQNPQYLLESWQTRLYLYLLAETSPYPPAQIAMTYWFFQTSPDGVTTPQHLRITYDRARHDRTHQDLLALLAQLTDWLHQYEAGHCLPQVTLGSKHCEGCTFATRCGRATAESSQISTAAIGAAFTPPTLKLDDIQEISL